MEFKIIETQEELDRIIGERLNRDRESRQKELKEKYGDLDELVKSKKSLEDEIGKLNSQIKEQTEKYASYDTQLAEMQAKVKSYETASVKQRIAHECGVPFEMAGRLTGETEDEIRTDAQTIAKFLKQKDAPPLGSTEPANATGKDAAYKQLLNNQKGD
jgi:predicted nuclease with TOPRIM domain